MSETAGLLTHSAPRGLPARDGQWLHVVSESCWSFTAAGLSGICTRFPFHPSGRMGRAGTESAAKVTINPYLQSDLDRDFGSAGRKQREPIATRRLGLNLAEKCEEKRRRHTVCRRRIKRQSCNAPPGSSCLDMRAKDVADYLMSV